MPHASHMQLLILSQAKKVQVIEKEHPVSLFGVERCHLSQCSMLNAQCSLLTTHYSLLAAHYSLLTTHYSLLTYRNARCSLITGHADLRPASPRPVYTVLLLSTSYSLLLAACS